MKGSCYSRKESIVKPVLHSIVHSEGGIEFGEKTIQTITREIREEIGADISDPKLLTVIENIFEFDGKPYHEITFLCSGNITDPAFLDQEYVAILDKKDAKAEWIPIADIQNGSVVVYPAAVVPFIQKV